MTDEEMIEITKYMQELEGSYLTNDEAKKIEDYVLYHFMGIVKKKNVRYSLTLFNAYLDDCELNDLPRFNKRYHDPRLLLNNGAKNPNYNKEYWFVM